MDRNEHVEDPAYADAQGADGRPGTLSSTINYRVLTSVKSYSEAQHIVDTLSDAGFPVENVRIVGIGLESVEQVTGRKTTWTSAWQSALAGAWMGLFFGLLFVLFAPVIAWRIILTAILLGLVFGGIAGAFTHALQGGRRDFSSFATTRASTYEIHVVAGLVDEASRLLRV